MTARAGTARLTQFAARRRLRLQDPARRARGHGPRADRASTAADLLVGLDDGDDAAAVRVDGDLAVLATADFFTPVVDDAYDWGRIAAANALSDIYAMGGRPVVAVNLLGWPRDVLPLELLGRGAARRPRRRAGWPAARWPAATASTTPSRSTAWPSPASPTRTGCCATTPPRPGLPLSLTKPLGVGVLNNRHKATGEVFPQAVESMVALNDVASRAALARRRRGGDRRHRLRPARPPVQDGARLGRRRPSSTPPRCPTSTAPARSLRGRLRAAAAADATSTGCAPTSTPPSTDDELLLLADAQTSGGLLVAGEIPGGTVIGELVPRGEHVLRVR